MTAEELKKEEYEAEMNQANANAEIAMEEAEKLLDKLMDTARELQEALRLRDWDARYKAIEEFVKSRECDLNAPSNPRKYITFSAEDLIKAIQYRDEAIQNAKNLFEDSK